MPQSRCEYALGNIYLRDHTLTAGEAIPPHRHNFDHATLVVLGTFRVSRTAPDGRTSVATLSAGDALLVPAEDLHTIECLEDGRVMCIYAHRDAQGRVVQRYQGNASAYV